MSIPTAHPYAFDPSCGMTLAALQALAPPPAPPGFAAFWQAQYAAARALDPRPALRDSPLVHPDWTVQEITYRSAQDFPIGGWLLRPRQGRVRRGLVIGHGYGGREAPDFDMPVRETALLFPCFRGLSRSAQPPISTDPQWHVLHDIDKRDRYILAGCAADLWTGVSVLSGLFSGLTGIGYAGISLGGGIGALAAPWDARIDRVHLEVPTFGAMPLWLTLPTVGSAAAVQRYAAAHPEVIETLRFYDAATAATRLTVPSLIAAARFDPAVAPPCQFTIANARAGHDHHETFVLDAGHFDYPDMAAQHARLRCKVRQFFEAA